METEEPVHLGLCPLGREGLLLLFRGGLSAAGEVGSLWSRYAQSLSSPDTPIINDKSEDRGTSYLAQPV